MAEETELKEGDLVYVIGPKNFEVKGFPGFSSNMKNQIGQFRRIKCSVIRPNVPTIYILRNDSLQFQWLREWLIRM